MTKKILSLLLAVIMLLSLVGCELAVIDPGGTGESVILEGSTPSDPSDPSAPSAPSDPVDPSAPSEPVDPSAPSDPVDPSTPAPPEEGGDEDQNGGSSGSNSKEEEDDTPPVSKPTSLDGLEIVKEAVKYLGTPYVYGGNSLTKGVDCSGFTTQIYKKFGISLPRTAAAQSKVSGTRVSLADAKPGDLYAVAYENDSRYTGHAGIYIGDGKMIHSSPSLGVECSKVGQNTTFIRLFDNTCSVSGTVAVQTLEKIAIANGRYGGCEDGTYDAQTGKMTLWGFSPLSWDLNGVLYLEIDLNDVPAGYEKLVAIWKEQFFDYDRSFSVMGSANPEGASERWAYYNGEWYSSTAFWKLYKDGGVTDYGVYSYDNSYKFIISSWNDDAAWTTANGEAVDLSTHPLFNTSTEP